MTYTYTHAYTHIRKYTHNMRRTYIYNDSSNKAIHWYRGRIENYIRMCVGLINIQYRNAYSYALGSFISRYMFITRYIYIYSILNVYNQIFCEALYYILLLSYH